MTGLEMAVLLGPPAFMLGMWAGALLLLSVWAFVPWKRMRRALVRDGRGPKGASS